MRVSYRWIATFALAVAGLVACSSAPLREANPPDTFSAQRPIPDAWTFEGRLALSNGKDGGSGRIRWTQEGEFFTISLRAPISGQSWQLSGDHSHARLEGVRPQPVLGTSARELLRRELGWELPVGDMKSWLFGRGFRAQARIQRDVAAQPSIVDDSGWNIAYRDWQQVDAIAVPRRIIAKKAPYQVRLAIQRWTFSAEGATGADH